MEATVKQRSTLMQLAIFLLILGAVLAGVWLIYEWMVAARDPNQANGSRLYRLMGSFVTNLIFTALLATIVLLYLWVRFARSLPELMGWHTQYPEVEFSADDETESYSFDDYLEQEARVFKQIGKWVETSWGTQQTGAFSRFRTDSVCNPDNVTDRNWNRSHVLQAENPIGGALLIHGLSDAPYSLRALGMRLHADGYTVIWLRVPGHGTCPAALANVSWQDWTAAVRVAVRSLRRLLRQDCPLFLYGYSNGGALSVHYALSTIEDPSLPKVTGVVLFSPMIGINPLARITRLYHMVALVSRNRKAQWSNISAEIDPYKYSSWPMNASVQAWAMTQVVERKLEQVCKAGKIAEMPPFLAMQSVVDSTVVVPNLITVLFDRLSCDRSELCLFDINRAEWVGNLFNLSFEKNLIPRLERNDVQYRLCILTNANTGSQSVRLMTRINGSWTEETTNLDWPEGIISLSHVAVPIPPGDTIYGTQEATVKSGLPLGSLSMRAEPSSLMVSDSLFVRCRYNPFYQYMEDRVIGWAREISK